MFKIPTNTWTSWLSPLPQCGEEERQQDDIGKRQQDDIGKRQQENTVGEEDRDDKVTEQELEAVNTDGMDKAEDDGDATPQAKPLQPSIMVPSFTLDKAHTSQENDEEIEDDNDDDDERDQLPPPVFPAINSAQRASSTCLKTTPDLMPPPPRPSQASTNSMPPPTRPSQASDTGSMPPTTRSTQASTGLMPPPRGPPVRSQPDKDSSLRVPSTGPLPNRGPPKTSSSRSNNSLVPPKTSSSRSNNSLALPTTSSRIDTPKSRNKVQLTPGHSPLDWATLARTKNLANVPNFVRVTPSMLKHFNGRKDKATGLRKDAWSVFQGKVYNISPYLPFHPGGEGELLRGAGKDGTAMFNDVHPWVNWEGMLGSCLVGVLVSETEESGGLESLD